MATTEPITKHLERLLARVEVLQQAVTQLYVELQSVHAHLEAAARGDPEAAEPPLALPVAPLSDSFYNLRPMDRRSSPRRQANQVLIAISSALDDSKPTTGWVLDYSANGLGIFVDRKLPVGTYLHIRPSPKAEVPQESFRGREAVVRNFQPYLDGYRLGCQVEAPFSAEDLQRFGLE